LHCTALALALGAGSAAISCQADAPGLTPLDAAAPAFHSGPVSAPRSDAGPLRNTPPLPPTMGFAPGQEDPSPLAAKHLIEAVACLEEGREAQAIVHLRNYLAHRPRQILLRAELAELLFRQKELEESRLQFERFISQAQEDDQDHFRYLIHSHSRLVEIAEQQNNHYHEYLNRGIGLYLLACRSAEEIDDPARPELSAEALFCRAAAQLQMARGESPQSARPHWYLYQVWRRLGQTAAADRSLKAADACQLFSPLTPCERRKLQLAWLQRGDAGRP